MDGYLLVIIFLLFKQFITTVIIENIAHEEIKYFVTKAFYNFSTLTMNYGHYVFTMTTWQI